MYDTSFPAIPTIPSVNLLRHERSIEADFSPLSQETYSIIKENFFVDSNIPGGIKDIQTYAKKVTALKDQIADFESGKIQKHRAIAIAKCVGAALLVAATVSFTISSIVIGGAPALLSLAIIPQVGLTLLSIKLLIENCKNAHRLMTLTPAKVHRELQQEINKNFSVFTIGELTSIERQLQEKVEELNIKICDLKQSKDRTGLESLVIKRNVFSAAFRDVERLCKALGA